MAIAEADLRAGATFDSLDPVTGEVVGTFPVHGPEDVAAALRRARGAASWWAGLDPRERTRRLLGFKAILARRSDELCRLVHRENGKPLEDAFIEVVLCVDHLDWAARNAPRLMRRRRVPSTWMQLDHAAEVEYLPVGVVGVVGPWNYPLHTPMGSISYALAAGNAVVFKPSEWTPAVGRWVADAFAEAVPEEPVLQVVTGYGATGEALCRDPQVDVVSFTGSAATGRKVMVAAADNLTKVVMECGGNDPMVVDRDADVVRAAEAALWGGVANGGQTCAGVERVYVVDDVYDAFLDALVAKARTLRPGPEDDAPYGPITMPGQVEVIRRHLDEALARGARAVVGGPGSIRPPFVDPVVLVDVPDDTAVMTEETFGPLLPVVRVRDVDEAVRRANTTAYALGATVFSRTRGMQIAERLDAGMVSVNAVLRFASIPALPFGGARDSGYGRIHGEDGLREFLRPKAYTRRRLPSLAEFASFDRPPWLFRTIGRLLPVLHGRHRV